MDKKVLENIINNKLISKGDRVCVAVSGGVDSVVLLHILNSIKDKVGFDLFAVHVNHNIRGAEAERDVQFVKDLGHKLCVDVIIKSVQVLDHAKVNKMTVEQSARVLRYCAIDEVVKQYKLDKVAVAHNLDDQAETVLMHMFRGSGLSGLEGMSLKSGYLIRPMLNCTKAEIEQFANLHHIVNVFDSTNNDRKYTRNYIRHEILPSIEKAYPAVKQNIYNLAQKVMENNNYINSIIPEDLLIFNNNSIVIKQEAKDIDEFLLKNLVRKVFIELNASVDVEEKHIKSICKLLSTQVGKKLDMPNDIVVTRTYLGLEFAKLSIDNFSSRPFKVGEKFDVALGEIVVRESISNKPEKGLLLIDRDKVPATAEWRKIQDGDKFTKFSGGTKTVNSFLVDKKIDVAERKKMVVLADGKNILVIPNVEISSSVKIEKNTKRVVEVCLVK